MKQLQSEQLKQCINGLPKGFAIEVNGKPCVGVVIGVREDNIYVVNFIADDREEAIINDEEITNQEVSCKNCEYYRKDIPHTCDMCTSLDNDEDYTMWKLAK